MGSVLVVVSGGVGGFGFGLFWNGGVVWVLFWFLGLLLFALCFVRSLGAVFELLQVSILAYSLEGWLALFGLWAWC